MAKLSRDGPDAWIARMDGVGEPVALRRGETLPGFPYDLAPTATRRDHDAWMQAVKHGYMLRWTPPPPITPAPASPR